MKAAICTKYGPPDVLQIREVERPAIKDGDVLVRIKTATVTAGDCELRGAYLPLFISLPMRLFLGIRGPRKPVLGMEFSGVIEEVGPSVQNFAAGDEIFAACGFHFGTWAEFKAHPADYAITKKPENISWAEAAAAPVGALNALHFLRKAEVSKGTKILIYGSTGSIGTFAVQLARHMGAEVTAVASPGNLDLVRSLGANEVYDYTKDDFDRSDAIYDVVFDTVGKSPYHRSLNLLVKGGRYVQGNPRLAFMLGAIWTRRLKSKKLIFQFADETSEDLAYVAELLETGAIKTVIDRSYALDDIREAHRYVEEGTKVGGVVIDVAV